jgi:hypothetical protein
LELKEISSRITAASRHQNSGFASYIIARGILSLLNTDSAAAPAIRGVRVFILSIEGAFPPLGKKETALTLLVQLASPRCSACS